MTSDSLNKLFSKNAEKIDQLLKEIQSKARVKAEKNVFSEDKYKEYRDRYYNKRTKEWTKIPLGKRNSIAARLSKDTIKYLLELLKKEISSPEYDADMVADLMFMYEQKEMEFKALKEEEKELLSRIDELNEDNEKLRLQNDKHSAEKKELAFKIANNGVTIQEQNNQIRELKEEKKQMVETVLFPLLPLLEQMTEQGKCTEVSEVDVSAKETSESSASDSSQVLSSAHQHEAELLNSAHSSIGSNHKRNNSNLNSGDQINELPIKRMRMQPINTPSTVIQIITPPSSVQLTLRNGKVTLESMNDFTVPKTVFHQKDQD